MTKETNVSLFYSETSKSLSSSRKSIDLINQKIYSFSSGIIALLGIFSAWIAGQEGLIFSKITLVLGFLIALRFLIKALKTVDVYGDGVEPRAYMNDDNLPLYNEDEFKITVIKGFQTKIDGNKSVAMMRGRYLNHSIETSWWTILLTIISFFVELCFL